MSNKPSECFTPQHDEAVELAHAYLELRRTLISGEEVSQICRALVALAADARSALSEKEAIPAAAYVLAIQQSVGSILSQYAANKILDRAKDIANGH